MQLSKGKLFEWKETECSYSNGKYFGKKLFEFNSFPISRQLCSSIRLEKFLYHVQQGIQKTG